MKRKILLILVAICFCWTLNVGAETCTEDCVAQIGDTKYNSINDAFNAVTSTDPVTITVLKDADDEPGIFLGAAQKNIIVDLNDHSVTIAKNAVGSTGTQTQAIHLEKGNTVVFKDGTIIVADVASIKMGIQNYCNLTLENVTFDASDTQMNYAISNNAGNISFIGDTNIYASEKENARAFDAYWWVTQGYKNGPKIVIDTTGEIVGNIEVTNSGTDFETGSVTSITIKNVKHTGILDIQDENANVVVTGGTFTDENVKDYISDLSKVTKDGDSYVVGDNTEIEATVEEGIVGFESEEALDNSLTLSVVAPAKEEATKATEAIDKKYAEDENVKDVKVINIYDIDVKDADGKVVEMKNGKFVISLPVKKELQKYDVYKVAYIKDGKIQEILDAELVDGKIVFATTHLSTYAVIGMNNVEKKAAEKDVEKNPKTADSLVLYLTIGMVSVIGAATTIVVLRKRMAN